MAESEMTSEDREANYFAMCLLMPEEFIRADVAKFRDAEQGFEEMVNFMAIRYEVSPARMTLRLAQLELIS